MAMVECEHNNIPGYCSICDDEMVAARIAQSKALASTKKEETTLSDVLRMTAHLHEYQDRLNAMIKRVEDTLVNNHVSVRASIDLNGGKMSYGKRNGQWGIRIDEAPILSTSREVRTVAAKEMPRLMEAILVSLQETIANLDEGTNRAYEALTALGGVLGGDGEVRGG